MGQNGGRIRLKCISEMIRMRHAAMPQMTMWKGSEKGVARKCKCKWKTQWKIIKIAFIILQLTLMTTDCLTVSVLYNAPITTLSNTHTHILS